MSNSSELPSLIEESRYHELLGLLAQKKGQLADALDMLTKASDGQNKVWELLIYTWPLVSGHKSIFSVFSRQVLVSSSMAEYSKESTQNKHLLLLFNFAYYRSLLERPKSKTANWYRSRTTTGQIKDMYGQLTLHDKQWFLT